MSPKAFLTLLALTIVALIGAAALIVSEQRAAAADEDTGGPMFPALLARGDDIATVRIEARRYTIELSPEGDGWVASDRGDYPTRPGPVEGIVSDLASLVAVEPKTANPDWYDEIGVVGVGPDSNTVRLTVTATDGEVLADTLVGFASSSIGFNQRGGIFVRPFDQPQAWLVEGTVGAPQFLGEFFEQLVHIPGTEVARIAIKIGDQVVIDAAKTDFTTGTYALSYLDPAYGPAGSTAIGDAFRGLSQAIVSTTLDDAKALEDVTFPPDARTVTFTTRAGLSLALRLGEADGSIWVAYTATAAEGSEAAAQAAQINARTSRWAFKLPEYRIVTLQKPVNELFTPPVAPVVAPVNNTPFLSSTPLIPGLNNQQTQSPVGLPEGMTLPEGLNVPGLGAGETLSVPGLTLAPR